MTIDYYLHVTRSALNQIYKKLTDRSASLNNHHSDHHQLQN